MSFCPWCLFYDGEEVGSYIELQQRQMWCFCLRGLLWQTHSFSAWLEKLFCHEKKCSCVDENMNCAANEANGSQHRSKSDLHWWLHIASVYCILKLSAKEAHHCLLPLQWLQSNSESQTNWDEGGDRSSRVPGLSGKALISPLVCLWHCSPMQLYSLQYIAWLTQY